MPDPFPPTEKLTAGKALDELQRMFQSRAIAFDWLLHKMAEKTISYGYEQQKINTVIKNYDDGNIISEDDEIAYNKNSSIPFIRSSHAIDPMKNGIHTECEWDDDKLNFIYKESFSQESDEIWTHVEETYITTNINFSDWQIKYYCGDDLSKKPDIIKREPKASGRKPHSATDLLWGEMCRQVYEGDIQKGIGQADVQRRLHGWLAERNKSMSDETMIDKVRVLFDSLGWR